MIWPFGSGTKANPSGSLLCNRRLVGSCAPTGSLSDKPGSLHPPSPRGTHPPFLQPGGAGALGTVWVADEQRATDTSQGQRAGTSAGTGAACSGRRPRGLWMGAGAGELRFYPGSSSPADGHAGLRVIFQPRWKEAAPSAGWQWGSFCKSLLRSRAWSAGELGQVGGRGKEPRATVQRPRLRRLTGGGLGGRSIQSGRPRSAREAWGSNGFGLSRWRSWVRWHRRGTRASQRGLVAPPGWPRYPEMRLRVALPRISKVRPRGSLARERSPRLRMPRLPPHRTAAAPTAGSGTSRPVWQPRFVPVAPGNQSCHGPFPWALSVLAARVLGSRASQEKWPGRRIRSRAPIGRWCLGANCPEFAGLLRQDAPTQLNSWVPKPGVPKPLQNQGCAQNFWQALVPGLPWEAPRLGSSRPAAPHLTFLLLGLLFLFCFPSLLTHRLPCATLNTKIWAQGSHGVDQVLRGRWGRLIRPVFVCLFAYRDMVSLNWVSVMRVTQHAWGDFKAKLIFKKKYIEGIMGLHHRCMMLLKLKCILCIPILDLHEMQLSCRAHASFGCSSCQLLWVPGYTVRKAN